MIQLFPTNQFQQGRLFLEEIEIIPVFFSDFQRTSTFAIILVRLVSGQVRADGFTGPRRKIDIRYEFGFKVTLTNLVYK